MHNDTVGVFPGSSHYFIHRPRDLDDAQRYDVVLEAMREADIYNHRAYKYYILYIIYELLTTLLLTIIINMTNPPTQNIIPGMRKSHSVCQFYAINTCLCKPEGHSRLTT